jgi:predicted RNase H-like HicB family nuclease
LDRGVEVKLLIAIYSDEDRVFIAECPSIPGRVSQGKTEKEAWENISDAIKERLGFGLGRACP